MFFDLSLRKLNARRHPDKRKNISTASGMFRIGDINHAVMY